MDERRFARSAHARHARQRVEWNRDVDVFQIVLAGTDQTKLLPRAAAPHGGHRNGKLLPQVLRRQRPRLVNQTVERSRVHDAPALLARSEPEIDDVIGNLDHVGVVFDHEYRVALIAQLPQYLDQPQIVARVQADRRLVEHV